jgi:hypothetical protein
MPSAEQSRSAIKASRHRVGLKRRFDTMADDLAALRSELRRTMAIVLERRQQDAQQARQDNVD